MAEKNRVYSDTREAEASIFNIEPKPSKDCNSNKISWDIENNLGSIDESFPESEEKYVKDFNISDSEYCLKMKGVSVADGVKCEISKESCLSFTYTTNYTSYKNATQYSESGEGRISEVALWRSVITQAVLDCVSKSKRTEDRVAREVAMSWFDMKDENFKSVCYMANLNASWVIERVRLALQNPESWRRSCDL